MAQMRRGDLLLAEGAGRRGGSRHVDSFPACGSSIGKLRAPSAAAEDFPYDQERQTRSGAVRRRDDQYAVVARHRGLSRRSEVGASASAVSQRCKRARMPMRSVLTEWVARTPWVDFLVSDAAIRSNTSVCLKVVDERVTSLPEAAQAEFAKNLAAILEKEGVALDAASYRSAPPGLAHLVRRHGRAKRSASSDAVARLGICQLPRGARDRRMRMLPCPKFSLPMS